MKKVLVVLITLALVVVLTSGCIAVISEVVRRANGGMTRYQKPGADVSTVDADYGDCLKQDASSWEAVDACMEAKGYTTAS
jgi:hypothetical protein